MYVHTVQHTTAGQLAHVHSVLCQLPLFKRLSSRSPLEAPNAALYSELWQMSAAEDAENVEAAAAEQQQPDIQGGCSAMLPPRGAFKLLASMHSNNRRTNKGVFVLFMRMTRIRWCDTVLLQCMHSLFKHTRSKHTLSHISKTLSMQNCPAHAMYYTQNCSLLSNML